MSKLSDEEKLVQDYKNVFNLFAGPDGGIDMKDLGTVMRTLGQTPSQNEVMRIMEKQDTDRNGILEFGEFL